MNDSDRTREPLVEELAALRRQVVALKADEHRRRVISRVRDQIWEMRCGEDTERLLEAVGSCLQELGVSFDQCGVNLLDRNSDPPLVTFHNIARNGQTIMGGSAQAVGVILKIMRHQAVAYRRDLHAEDPYQERKYTEAIFEHPVRAVVDVPFSHGTLAANARQPDAFSPQDLEILQEMAKVLSEGFTRMEDLGVLEQRNQELEEEIVRRRQMEERLREEQRRRESRSAVRLRIASMDRPEDLFGVVQEIHAQLRALGVECDSATIQIVNPEGTDFVSVGEREYPHWDKLVSGAWGELTPHAERYPWVLQVWKTNSPLYQPCLPEECGLLAGCSLIDVPFSHGTLAINCRRPRAFSERGTALLQHFASVLSEGFQRFESLVERQRIEKDLRASEERFRTLAETAGAGIVIVQGAKFAYVNTAAEALSEYTREELQAMDFWDVAHPHYRGLVREQGLARLRGEPGPPRFEIQFLKKSGESCWLDFSVATCSFAGNPALIGVAIDISGRKRAEAQLHVYQRELRSLAAALVLAEERERRRIATELHDHIGQDLALTQVRLGALRAALSSTERVDELDQVRQVIDQTLQDVRSLTFELSPPILYELGLEAAVESLAERFQKQHGLVVEVEDDGQPKPLEEEVRVVLFRAVRELLVNVVKHAGVRQARVILRREGKVIRLAVEDDGVGFDLAEPEEPRIQSHKFGLFSIRERLDLLGGSFRVEAASDQGTRVELVAPLRHAEGVEEVKAE